MRRFDVVPRSEADKDAAEVAQKILDSVDPDALKLAVLADLQARMMRIEDALGIWGEK